MKERAGRPLFPTGAIPAYYRNCSLSPDIPAAEPESIFSNKKKQFGALPELRERKV